MKGWKSKWMALLTGAIAGDPRRHRTAHANGVAGLAGANPAGMAAAHRDFAGDTVGKAAVAEDIVVAGGIDIAAAAEYIAAAGDMDIEGTAGMSASADTVHAAEDMTGTVAVAADIADTAATDTAPAAGGIADTAAAAADIADTVAAAMDTGAAAENHTGSGGWAFAALAYTLDADDCSSSVSAY